MSLINGESSEDNHRKDSFEDRICDDLCEHILQYLSLEDRLRLECLSKQFRRTIFERPMILIIDMNDKNCLKKTEYILNRFNSEQIKWIKLAWSSFSSDPLKTNYNSIIELINKNCQNLRHFNDENRMYYIREDIYHKFIDKFVSKLLELNFIDYCFPLKRFETIFASLLESNAKKVKIHYSLTNHLFISDIHFKQLKSLKVFELKVKDLDLFETFAKRNAQNIRHLYIDCHFIPEDNKRVLNILEKFKNLIHLSLFNTNYDINDESFAKHFTQISLNCNYLKSLSLTLKTDVLSAESLAPIKRLKQLKRLELYLKEKTSMRQTFEFSFSDCNGFQALTHFHIEFIPFFCSQLSETVLTDIDINLPKLQYLVINSVYLNTSEWTAYILSRLKDLKEIKILLLHNKFEALIKSKLKEKNKRLTKINIF